MLVQQRRNYYEKCISVRLTLMRSEKCGIASAVGRNFCTELESPRRFLPPCRLSWQFSVLSLLSRKAPPLSRLGHLIIEGSCSGCLLFVPGDQPNKSIRRADGSGLLIWTRRRVAHRKRGLRANFSAIGAKPSACACCPGANQSGPRNSVKISKRRLILVLALCCPNAMPQEVVRYARTGESRAAQGMPDRH